MPDRTSSGQFKGTVQPNLRDDLSAQRWREDGWSLSHLWCSRHGANRCSRMCSFLCCSWFLLAQKIWEEVFAWRTSQGVWGECAGWALCARAALWEGPTEIPQVQMESTAPPLEALMSHPGKTSHIRDFLYWKSEPLCVWDGHVCIRPGCSNDVILCVCLLLDLKSCFNYSLTYFLLTSGSIAVLILYSTALGKG